MSIYVSLYIHRVVAFVLYFYQGKKKGKENETVSYEGPIEKAELTTKKGGKVGSRGMLSNSKKHQPCTLYASGVVGHRPGLVSV